MANNVFIIIPTKPLPSLQPYSSVKAVSITSFEGPSSLTYGDSVSYTCVVAGGRAPYKVAMQVNQKGGPKP